MNSWSFFCISLLIFFSGGAATPGTGRSPAGAAAGTRPRATAARTPRDDAPPLRHWAPERRGRTASAGPKSERFALKSTDTLPPAARWREAAARRQGHAGRRRTGPGCCWPRPPTDAAAAVTGRGAPSPPRGRGDGGGALCRRGTRAPPCRPGEGERRRRPGRLRGSPPSGGQLSDFQRSGR